jgi:glycosyltransferase domain-containing protein
MSSSRILSHLTVVIPSFGRHAYLERGIGYWRNTGVTLIILDGSPKAWEPNISLPFNIHYWHIPESIEKRFLFAASLVETRYAILLSDDEFMLLSGLESCIRYLDEQVDFVSCKGAALGFQYIKGVTAGNQIYPNLRSSYSVNQATPLMRMIQHMRPYNMTTLWAVMRKDVFTATLRAMGGGPFKSAAAGEMQTSLLASYFGKCHVIDELVWLRSFENKNIWWDAGNCSILTWYMHPENSGEVERFFQTIEAQAVGSVGSDTTPIREWLIAAMAEYIHGSRQLPESKSARNRITSIIREHTPEILKSIFRKPPLRLTMAAKKLSHSGVRVNFEELSKIESLILKFHLTKSNKL